MARNDYQERQEARRERLERAAERAQDNSNAAYAAADDIAKRRPLGQPILVGHHSERGARADQKRIERSMDRSVAERAKAKNLERRADAVGKGGVSSDDPEAIAKLARNLEELEARHAKRKAINAAWRRAGKPSPDDTDRWAALAPKLELSDAGVHQLRLQVAQRWSYDKGAPFPPYTLTNANSEMRRLRERIEELRAAELAEDLVEDHSVCQLIEDTHTNRVQLVFEGKPSDEVRALLKQQGFRWARSVGAWQRLLNDNGRSAARHVIAQLQKEAH